ncbi:hypothetical protein GCM10009554_41950 [Kribbella koreensis]|uniref:PASTA domain-containing protein n=2 Tax=Kribbella TaxID=182639 RepID=A0ABP6VQQ2_9ACTN
MNTRLEPPRVPPLSPAQRSRLRNRVMDTNRPPSKGIRRWAVPALAVAATFAVVAGTLVAVDQHSGSSKPDVPPAGDPGIVNRDLGPATPQQVKAAIKDCMIPHSRPLQTVWSRRVFGEGGPADTPGTIVLVREPAPRPTGHPPLSFCLAPVPVATGHEESEIAKIPTAAQGILIIDRTTAVRPPSIPPGRVGPSGKLPPDGPRSSNAGAEVGTSLMRVRPGIARLESRFVWTGGAGPWTEGAVADGFGFTQSVVDTGATPRAQQREEFRAFDSSGNPVPLRY